MDLIDSKFREIVSNRFECRCTTSCSIIEARQKKESGSLDVESLGRGRVVPTFSRQNNDGDLRLTHHGQQLIRRVHHELLDLVSNQTR